MGGKNFINRLQELKHGMKSAACIMSFLISLLVILHLAVPGYAASNYQWDCTYDQDSNTIDITAYSGTPIYTYVHWQDVTDGSAGAENAPYSTSINLSDEAARTEWQTTIQPPGYKNGDVYAVTLYFISGNDVVDTEATTVTWGDINSGTAAAGSNSAAASSASYNPKGGVFIELVASLVDGVTDVFDWASGSLLKDENGKTITMGTLIFNDGLSAADKLSAPFTADYLNVLWAWYRAVAAGTFVLVIIAVVVTAFKFTAAPFNTSLREDAVASMWRWLCAILIIAGAPILFYAMLQINNGLVDLFLAIFNKVAPGQSLDVMLTPGSSPQTGYILADSMISLIFSFIRLWLAVLYALRKLVLTVILIFTPVMAWLWSLNKNVNATQIWLGELMSNIFMQTAHAFVFLILLSFISVSGGSGGAAPPSGDANALYQSLSFLLTNYGIPIGGAILFASVCWVAVQIITSKLNPGRRESAVTNLVYVGAGGIIFGGVMFFASLALGIAQTYFPSVFK